MASSSSSAQEALKEAKKLDKEAHDALKTGLMKFRLQPDYLKAMGPLQTAAQKYRHAGYTKDSTRCLQKRAECNANLGNFQGAAIDLEKAIQTMKSTKSNRKGAANQGDGDTSLSNEETAELWQDAAKYFFQAENIDRGANAYMKAGDLMMADGKADKAQEMYQSAYDAFKGSDKHVYAVDVGKKVLKAYLKHRWYYSAMKLMSDMTTRFSALKQPHNVQKMILSRIVLLLVEGEVGAAQQELDSAFSLDGFLDSKEAEAAEKLIAAFKSGDEQAVADITKENTFRFLDPAICKAAREGISPTGLNETADRVQAASDKERATDAVQQITEQADDLGLGGKVRSYGPRQGTAAAQAYSAQQETAEDDAAEYGMTAADSQRVRSELFSVPKKKESNQEEATEDTHNTGSAGATHDESGSEIEDDDDREAGPDSDDSNEQQDDDLGELL
eukprot:gb/GECG01013720.1/.p1 GENE.gb/GECG01013720.1/~~gb/GECG01013720.1/.p1  ORF type:complete len:446 (+),score=100.42 gb/GECG01013720.1/:1-1338(+)